MIDQSILHAEPPGLVVLAGGRFVVSVAYFMELQRLVQDRIADLPAREIVTVEWLLGVPFWHQLSAGDRRVAGLCISRMASERSLPLTRCTIPGKTCAYYRLP